ncbi:hypothetical protein FLJC2902T_22900 [Flavobacterium limnosediminis JC2902]|uniref:Uncharacterized protein n=1 Tax=Flavobacterium limnosediminis JC2902 TaxID=1341181 RepID=V6SR93_9FLAO|nr:hypothetical protein FLJC2902T_22900 [Flavobacterium limnosediminis JC2902]
MKNQPAFGVSLRSLRATFSLTPQIYADFKNKNLNLLRYTRN